MWPSQPRLLKLPEMEGRKGKPKTALEGCSPGPMQAWPGWDGRNRVPPTVRGKLTELAHEVHVNGEVQVMIILGTGPHARGATALLTSLHCQVVFHVEHCSTTRTGTRDWWSLSSCSSKGLDVEVSHRSFHFTCRQKLWRGESQVFYLDSVDAHSFTR